MGAIGWLGAGENQSEVGGKTPEVNVLPHIGSSLDDFLEEDGVLEEVDAIAIERVLACLVQELMPEKGLTTTEIAQEMNTTSSSFSNFAALE
jgi:hypothetical protein